MVKGMQKNECKTTNLCTEHVFVILHHPLYHTQETKFVSLTETRPSFNDWNLTAFCKTDNICGILKSSRTKAIPKIQCH